MNKIWSLVISKNLTQQYWQHTNGHWIIGQSNRKSNNCNKTASEIIYHFNKSSMCDKISYFDVEDLFYKGVVTVAIYLSQWLEFRVVRFGCILFLDAGRSVYDFVFLHFTDCARIVKGHLFANLRLMDFVVRFLELNTVKSVPTLLKRKHLFYLLLFIWETYKSTYLKYN